MIHDHNQLQWPWAGALYLGRRQWQTLNAPAQWLFQFTQWLSQFTKACPEHYAVT